MPTKRIDKCCNKATHSRQTINFKICPIPSEQSRAAKKTNNKKTKQKTAVQISPQDHNYRQQKNCRQQEKLSSLQTFSIEYHAKQHCRNVWRSGEVNIW